MANRYEDQPPGRTWRTDRERDRERQRTSPYGSNDSAYGQREPYNTGGTYNTGGSRYSESQFGQRRDPRERGEYRPGPSRQYGSGDFGYEGGRRGEPSFGEENSPRYFGSGNYSEGGAHYTGGYDPRGTQSRQPPADAEYGNEGAANRERDSGRRAGGLFQRSAFKRGPKGYQRSDDRLREDISERLMLSHDVDSSDVTVTVQNGKVTLEGTVPDRYMKHYIEDLADACPGVQDVDNRIRVVR